LTAADDFPRTWGEAYEAYKRDASVTRIMLATWLIKLGKALDEGAAPGDAGIAAAKIGDLADDLQALVDGMNHAVLSRSV
jgi:hypothetical protein